ncbi:MAG: hypothetical protein PHD42_02640 [Dysgonamonadaceae bacterium]|nr:hypothetical protein [Dysgonamonadaceae bacterium]
MNSGIPNDIEKKIYELGEEHQNNPGIILTETDMQCFLYRKLLEIDFPGRLADTKDGYGTYPLHTELSWYDQNGKLALKPDITILRPEYLNITSRRNIDLPKKGYSFSGGGFIFELKFNRFKTTTHFLKSIRKILKKLRNFKEFIQIHFVISFGLANTMSVIQK